MAEIGTDLAKAAHLLEKGELVAIPTETVYGLAGNALNEKAVLNIFVTKARPQFDPLIVHVASIDEVEKYAEWHDESLKKLAKKYWPGPLTILLPKKNNIPELVTSGLNQVAIRVPHHETTLQLLNKISFPLAAPSANPFGYISPTSAAHVNKQLGEKIAYILDGGPCQVGLESTIVGIENKKICVYRLGGLSLEAIEIEIGTIELKLNQSSNPMAPGQLLSHYAPRKPLLIGSIEEKILANRSKKIAIIIFGKNNFKNNLTFNLSETSNIKEAAINLFKMLRLADDSDADIILTQYLPEIALGKAINDRLKRAAGN
jgi:L-threonylcarbamoyladenylate synthase